LYALSNHSATYSIADRTRYIFLALLIRRSMNRYPIFSPLNLYCMTAMGVFLQRPFVSLSSCWMEQIIGNLLSIIRGGNKEGSWPAQDDWCCFDPHWLKVGEYNQHAACQPVKAPEFGPSAVRFGPYYLVIMDGLHGPGNAAIGSYYMGLLKTTGPSDPLYKGLKHLSTKIA
jgi:hypothetical protein